MFYLMVRESKNRKGIFNTLEWVWSLLSQVWAVIKDFPIIGWFFAGASSMIGFMLAVLDRLSPAYVYLIALAAFAITIFIIDRVLTIRRKMAFNPKEFKEFGIRLQAKAEDMRSFVFSKYEVHNIIGSTPIKDRTERSGAVNRVSIEFQQKYGPDILYECRLLKELGIDVPQHVASMHGHAPHSLADFFMYIGKLLQEGYLEQARQVDNEFGFRFMDNYFHF